MCGRQSVQAGPIVKRPARIIPGDFPSCADTSAMLMGRNWHRLFRHNHAGWCRVQDCRTALQPGQSLLMVFSGSGNTSAVEADGAQPAPSRTSRNPGKSGRTPAAQPPDRASRMCVGSRCCFRSRRDDFPQPARRHRPGRCDPATMTAFSGGAGCRQWVTGTIGVRMVWCQRVATTAFRAAAGLMQVMTIPFARSEFRDGSGVTARPCDGQVDMFGHR